MDTLLVDALKYINASLLPFPGMIVRRMSWTSIAYRDVLVSRKAGADSDSITAQAIDRRMRFVINTDTRNI